MNVSNSRLIAARVAGLGIYREPGLIALSKLNYEIVRDYLIHRSGPWKGYPIRTFQAGRYTGGYSDHLPVFLDFENKKPESPEVR